MIMDPGAKTPSQQLRELLRLEFPSIDVDDLTLLHLASFVEGDTFDEDAVVEAWSPFWIDYSVASSDAAARDICLRLIQRLKSGDSFATSSTTAAHSSASSTSILTAPHERMTQQRGEEELEALTTTVAGLDEWLKDLRLQEYRIEALAWCSKMGACDVDEVRDNWEEFSAALKLKTLQKKRVQKNVQDVCRAQRDIATGTSASSTHKPRPDDSFMQNVHVEQFGPQGGQQYTYRPEHDRLGSGATASVYKCTRMKEGVLETYAVKKICLKKLKLSNDFESMKEKLHRESSLLFLFRHAHIVSLYDVVEEPDNLYLVMELVEGGDLSDHIRQTHGGMPEDEAKYVFIQLVEALKYIHDKNVVHRDLKPDNILINRKVSKRGLLEIKISDFGHSKLLNDGYSITLTQIGTPEYWAPEVSEVNPAKGYDAKVDLWSLGVVLYVMLEGTTPWCVAVDGVNTRRGSLIQELIRKAAFDFKDQYGRRPSADARDLIRRLIKVLPKERISLKECESHRWVSMNGKVTRVMEAFVDNQVDEERIFLPHELRDNSCAPGGYIQFRRDLGDFTARNKFAATLQDKCEVNVVWQGAGSTTPSQVEGARQELEKLFQHHFPGFKLPPRGNTCRAAAPYPANALPSAPYPPPPSPSSHNNASAPRSKTHNELAMPPTPDREERPPRRSDTSQHGGSTFRLIKAVIRVVQGTAGLVLEEELKGMRVVGVDVFPGQDRIQVDDLIIRIDQATLASNNTEHVKQIFGQHFRDGAEVTIKRKSNRA